MSAPNQRVSLSARARRDIQGLLLYSGELWGVEQRRRYRGSIDQALEALATNPRIGRPRNDLFEGCRSFPAGQHVIYYRTTEKGIAVSRILHNHQDVRTATIEPEP